MAGGQFELSSCERFVGDWFSGCSDAVSRNNVTNAFKGVVDSLSKIVASLSWCFPG